MAKRVYQPGCPKSTLMRLLEAASEHVLGTRAAVGDEVSMAVKQGASFEDIREKIPIPMLYKVDKDIFRQDVFNALQGGGTDQFDFVFTGTTIKHYIHHIMHQMVYKLPDLSGVCFLAALLYIDRLYATSPSTILTSQNVLPLYTVAVVLAWKFCEDDRITSSLLCKYVFEIGQFDMMNEMEWNFFKLVEFNLFITERELEAAKVRFLSEVGLLYNLMYTHFPLCMLCCIRSTLQAHEPSVMFPPYQVRSIPVTMELRALVERPCLSLQRKNHQFMTGPNDFLQVFSRILEARVKAFDKYVGVGRIETAGLDERRILYPLLYQANRAVQNGLSLGLGSNIYSAFDIESQSDDPEVLQKSIVEYLQRIRLYTKAPYVVFLEMMVIIERMRLLTDRLFFNSDRIHHIIAGSFRVANQNSLSPIHPNEETWEKALGFPDWKQNMLQSQVHEYCLGFLFISEDELSKAERVLFEVGNTLSDVSFVISTEDGEN